MEIVKLSKPLIYEGETINEIKLDLDNLSVIDLERCERQARTMLKRKETMAVPETSKKYQSCVAAKASGLTIDAIRSLSARDYTAVCLEVMNFLLGGDSEEDDEEENTPKANKAQEKVGKTPTSTTPMTSTVTPSAS